jgi:hypothetical protein
MWALPALPFASFPVRVALITVDEPLGLLA